MKALTPKHIKSAKDFYQSAIEMADQVLRDPQNSVNELVRQQLGYSNGVKGFLSDPVNWLLMSNPLLIGSRVLYQLFKNKERQRREMEMMKRQIIAKQQAIINRLEEQNYQNELQRQHLQETIDFLEEALKRMKK